MMSNSVTLFEGFYQRKMKNLTDNHLSQVWRLKNIIAFLFICFSFLTSCKKSTEELVPPTPYDYRQAWVGDYDVHAECYSWILGGDYNTSEFDELVTVSIVEGSTDSIRLNEGSAIYMDTSGTYFTNPAPSNYYELRLWSDSIYIRYNSGGLGGGSGCTKNGVKL